MKRTERIGPSAYPRILEDELRASADPIDCRAGFSGWCDIGVLIDNDMLIIEHELKVAVRVVVQARTIRCLLGIGEACVADGARGRESTQRIAT